MFAGSETSTSIPFLQFLIISLGPPSSVATTGTPQAAASIKVKPKGSVNAALTKTPPISAAIR